MNSEPVGLLVAVALVALLVGATSSAGEAAVLRATRSAVQDAARPGSPRLGRALTLLGTRQVAAQGLSFVRVVAEVTTITCLTLVVARWLDEWWAVLLTALGGSIVIAVAVVRVSPRSVGRRHPATVLLALARPISWAARCAAPFVRVEEVPVEESERELQEMVERVGDSPAIEAEERELLQSVFELGDTLTREVMVPRTDMVTIGRDVPVRKALALFLRSGFSRIPVTGRSTDDLVGVLFLKDVTRFVLPDSAHPAGLDRPVGGLVRRAFFVPESKPVDDLLRQMQVSSSHIAMVVDEYGGIAGLVTIEDALEEIVGELTDEHDPPETDPEDLGDGRIRVPARMAVDDLGELFGLDIDDDDVDTAGGLLAKALGKVPLPGSAATISGLRLEAERAEGRRKQLATIVASRDQASPPPDGPAEPQENR